MNALKMIPSLLLLYVSLLMVSVGAYAPHAHYDWIVSFSQRDPLGSGVNKQVIVINDQFPGPLLNATTNDVITVNIHNNLTEPFLMTWNGVQMRKNSWNDGVQGTNCPIEPGQNWTYSFQVKDQIGSFFYFPSLLLHKAAGGYGAIRVNNRPTIPIPFPQPFQEYDVLIGDWYNADHRELRASLDEGRPLPPPDGILINGLGPKQAVFDFEPGKTYRLRISNVGSKRSLNLRIEDHLMKLVETEGSYTVQEYYESLDIHVGQSYSVLVTAKNQSGNKPYFMVASSRFTPFQISGVGIVRYPDSEGEPIGPLPQGPKPYDFWYSAQQARSIRWNLGVGAARPNPQGSFHYGNINISRTIVLENGLMLDGSKLRHTVNEISFVNPHTPLKLADYYRLNDVFKTTSFPDTPAGNRVPALGASVVDATYHDFYHIIFQNPLPFLQTWHLDGYNFFVVGMEHGKWDVSKVSKYNMVDAVSRSTIQVYPHSWTAIMVELDNRGMWNLRSQDVESWYLGQELYLRVKGEGEEDPLTISTRDEDPIPANVIKCGRAA